MTSDRFLDPPYNYARGAAVQSGAPPFDFERVIMRNFTLKASTHALQLFCDRYLNIAPEFAWFEAAGPFVLLAAINYGRMGPAASNTGYVSQIEVAFQVPLNWYRIEDGRRVFHASATVCPFIFVDEPSSVWTGREVYGWPKSLVWLTPGVDAWARDPRAPRTLFAASAMVFERLFAGQRQQPELVFEIEEAPSPTVTEFPPEPFNPLNPLLSWPRTLLGSLEAASSMAEMMVKAPWLGYSTPEESAPFAEVVAKALGGFDLFSRLPPANTINLKQFRDSQQPEAVSYQALINAQMATRSFNRGGLLGEQAMALGDLSGGFRIKIHRHPGWPIIESLGLEVAEQSVERGRTVSTLEPLFPFWVDVDFRYGKGEVLCWRTRHTDWAGPREASRVAVGGAPAGAETVEDSAPAAAADGADPADLRRLGLDPCSCSLPHLYNTSEGGAVQQAYGPFDFSNATVRVLPLLADWEKLREFCDGYLNDGCRTQFETRREEAEVDGVPKVREYYVPFVGTDGADRRNLFVPWGSYVYLIVTSYEEMSSELNIGWWARRRVAFAFPVKWYQRDAREGEEGWQLKSLGLVSPYVYADTGTAAEIGREMQGWPVTEARIESPAGPWLEDCGPVRPAERLTLCTEVFPALNAGQKLESRLLLEVTGRDVLPPTDEKGWQRIAAEWGERLMAETRRKQWWMGGLARGAFERWPGSPLDDWTPYRRLQWLKSQAFEILVAGLPINQVSLKQFRDAESPERACYQALNLYPEQLERIHDLRALDERLHVAIHRYPTQPIVKTLGLAVKWTDETGPGVVDYLQPIRPFWMQVDMKADLGRDVFWRAGTETWLRGDRCPLYFDEPETLQQHVALSYWVEDDPRNRRRLQDFRTRHVQREAEDLASDLFRFEVGSWGRDSFRDSLRAYRWREQEGGEDVGQAGLEPQLAIESIIGNRWLDFAAAEEEAAEQAPDPGFTIRQDTLGHPGTRDEFETIHNLEPLDPDYWRLAEEEPPAEED